MPLDRSDDADQTAPAPVTFALAVGVDLVKTGDVAESIARFGEKYLRRLFTDDEIAFCRADPRLSTERFAARFAAKEAAMKVLRPRPADTIDWRSIEVRRAPEGWCDIALHGSAAAVAVREGIAGFAVSLSHERDYATATVVANRAIRASL